ncbi:MAG: hypothetical protein U0802_14110 [Candidatus Binatia bacterium]
MMQRLLPRITTAATAVALTAALAVAQGPPPPGRPPGPPPIALAACAQADEGDACHITGQYGEHIAGTCALVGEQLACVPDDGPPPRPERD